MLAPVGWSTAPNGVRRLPGRTATTRAAATTRATATGTATAAAAVASCASRARATTRTIGSTNLVLHPGINSLHDWISFFESKINGHPTTSILTQGHSGLHRMLMAASCVSFAGRGPSHARATVQSGCTAQQPARGFAEVVNPAPTLANVHVRPRAHPFMSRARRLKRVRT